LRLPQLASFREALNARSTFRFDARIKPICATIVGPPDVATRISVSIAACHSTARDLLNKAIGISSINRYRVLGRTGALQN
jgi:hypothetical protein